MLSTKKWQERSRKSVEMSYANRSQISKWKIIDFDVFKRARENCPTLPPASGNWLELHWWSHSRFLNLTDYSGGVTYGTKKRGNYFFFLEFEGKTFAEKYVNSAKNYVPQYWKRADGREYWQ